MKETPRPAATRYSSEQSLLIPSLSNVVHCTQPDMSVVNPHDLRASAIAMLKSDIDAAKGQEVFNELLLRPWNLSLSGRQTH